MTYPKVSTTGEHTGAAFGVPASPRLPQMEEAVLAHWEADGTFEASVEQRDRPGSDGENEFVFYDGPPFANGLPHYGHLLTGYVKDVVAALPDDARPPGRAPLRLGHPRPARRARGDAR